MARWTATSWKIPHAVVSALNNMETRLASALVTTSEWETMHERTGAYPGAGTQVHAVGFGTNTQLVSTGNPASFMFHFDPADLALTGETLSMRLKVQIITASVVPGQNIAVSMNPVTFTGTTTGATVTVGSATSTVTITSATMAAAGTAYAAVGSTFSAPSAGMYGIFVTPAGSVTTWPNIRAALQYRNVDT